MQLNTTYVLEPKRKKNPLVSKKDHGNETRGLGCGSCQSSLSSRAEPESFDARPKKEKESPTGRRSPREEETKTEDEERRGKGSKSLGEARKGWRRQA